MYKCFGKKLNGLQIWYFIVYLSKYALWGLVSDEELQLILESVVWLWFGAPPQSSFAKISKITID